jgi:hypothetical protein
MTQPAAAPPPPDRFAEAVAKLAGHKVRLYVGGGERGYLQGPVVKVDGNLIYIEKEGPIRGTRQTITINADTVRYFEIDKLVQE